MNGDFWNDAFDFLLFADGFKMQFFFLGLVCPRNRFTFEE